MSIIQNKKAYHEYFIEEKHEAGIMLEGWEVKAIRAGRVHVKEAYVVIRQAELFLIGCHITPLLSASTHIVPDSTRTRNSFALAARRLGADTLDFSASTSSVSKGETLVDTAKNIEAMGVEKVKNDVL